MIHPSNQNQNPHRDLLFHYPMILTVTQLPMIVALVIAGANTCTSQSDQNYETYATSRLRVDESKFITYPSYSMANTPPLLRNLAENEEIVYALVKDFYTRFGQEPEDIITELWPPTLPPFKLMHSYLTNFEVTSGSLQLTLKRQTTEDPNNINRAFKTAWNPLTTYFMLQRVLNTLKEIIRNLNPTKDAELTLQNQIFHVMKSGGWPVEDDVTSALRAILRIQHMYDLPTHEISAGKLAGYETNLNLSAEDCVELGEEALIEEGGVYAYYALAVEWFEEARRRKIREKVPSVTPLAEIDDSLRYAIELHDEKWSSEGKIRDTLFFTKRCKYLESLLPRIRRRTTELAALKSGKVLNPNVKRHIKYWGTCSGQNYQSDSERAKLFCWYETEVNPYHKINPLKAELLSIEPIPIIQYYDMIGDHMISMIKFETGHQLAHSSVFTDNVGETQFSAFRASSTSLVDDITLREFSSIPRHVEAAMGLRMDSLISSEMLQVAAYTSGGHYTLHTDALKVYGDDSGNMNAERKRIYAEGDRMATFMFYLGDVEKGGGTSFPLSGIAVEPVKGSAVLWFNSMRNGEADFGSWHGGCPVIIGEKWIATKWILSSEQMFHKDYQCVSDQKARLALKINGKYLMDLV